MKALLLGQVQSEALQEGIREYSIYIPQPSLAYTTANVNKYEIYTASLKSHKVVYSPTGIRPQSWEQIILARD